MIDELTKIKKTVRDMIDKLDTATKECDLNTALENAYELGKAIGTISKDDISYTDYKDIEIRYMLELYLKQCKYRSKREIELKFDY